MREEDGHEQDPPKWITTDLKSVHKKTLAHFVTKQSVRFFDRLQLPRALKCGQQGATQ